MKPILFPNKGVTSPAVLYQILTKLYCHKSFCFNYATKSENGRQVSVGPQGGQEESNLSLLEDLAQYAFVHSSPKEIMHGSGGADSILFYSIKRKKNTCITTADGDLLGQVH